MKRLPPWLKVTLGSGENYRAVRHALAAQGLHTVCGSARCPNLGECWSSGTATFLILGTICTRNCRFCAVSGGVPDKMDPGEPARVADAVEELRLKYAVITSVTRDDLPDGGAGIFASVIQELRNRLPDVKVEVLIPDFQGDAAALNCVLKAAPDVLNHNIETVPRLYSSVRPQADYSLSLAILKNASESLGESHTKSGLMLGMGETRSEILSVFADLRQKGTGRLTLGQYLQPTRRHLAVSRFLHPDEFSELGRIASSYGFTKVASGPLVRSSYHASDMPDKLKSL